jgi:hypothetical protein
MFSGGFDPDRLAPPGRTEPIVSRIVGHSLGAEHEPSSGRLDESCLLKTFRDLLVRFDELRRDNAQLRDKNAVLQAEAKEARERLAGLEQSLAALSETSRSALATAAMMLERAERDIESRRVGTQAGIDGRFEAAKKRAVELQMTAALMLEEARELAARRALEADLETLGVIREGRKSILVLVGDLQAVSGGQGGPSVVPSSEEGAMADCGDARG